MSSDVDAILDDVHEAIGVLAKSNGAAATRLAVALSAWIAGKTFDQAIGLQDNWRERKRRDACDEALKALLNLHPKLTASEIDKGVARADRIRGSRPAGELGLYVDLLNFEGIPDQRTWRRLLAGVRGQSNGPVVRHKAAPSTQKEHLINGPTKTLRRSASAADARTAFERRAADRTDRPR